MLRPSDPVPWLPRLIPGERVEVVDAKDRLVLARYDGAIGTTYRDPSTGTLMLWAGDRPLAPIDVDAAPPRPNTVIVERLTR